MTKVTIYWSEGPETIEFDDDEAAHWFIADALQKCGSVTVEVKTTNKSNTRKG